MEQWQVGPVPDYLQQSPLQQQYNAPNHPNDLQ